MVSTWVSHKRAGGKKKEGDKKTKITERTTGFFFFKKEGIKEKEWNNYDTERKKTITVSKTNKFKQYIVN